MTDQRPLTIDSFFKYCSEGKLMAANCRTCTKILVPPRELCPDCLSSEMEWVELKGVGELLTYTIVHVAQVSFQNQVPYAIGIVRLTEGPALLGLIRQVLEDRLKVGMPLRVQFEPTGSKGWQPQWRFYFVPE